MTSAPVEVQMQSKMKSIAWFRQQFGWKRPSLNTSGTTANPRTTKRRHVESLKPCAPRKTWSKTW